MIDLEITSFKPHPDMSVEIKLGIVCVINKAEKAKAEKMLIQTLKKNGFHIGIMLDCVGFTDTYEVKEDDKILIINLEQLERAKGQKFSVWSFAVGDGKINVGDFKGTVGALTSEIKIGRTNLDYWLLKSYVENYVKSDNIPHLTWNYENAVLKILRGEDIESINLKKYGFEIKKKPPFRIEDNVYLSLVLNAYLDQRAKAGRAKKKIDSTEIAKSVFFDLNTMLEYEKAKGITVLKTVWANLWSRIKTQLNILERFNLIAIEGTGIRSKIMSPSEQIREKLETKIEEFKKTNAPKLSTIVSLKDEKLGTLKGLTNFKKSLEDLLSFLLPLFDKEEGEICEKIAKEGIGAQVKLLCDKINSEDPNVGSVYNALIKGIRKLESIMVLNDSTLKLLKTIDDLREEKYGVSKVKKSLRTNKILSELAKLNRTIVNPSKWRKIKEDNLTFVVNKISDTKSELEILDALEDLKEQRNFTKIYYDFLHIIDKEIVETISSKAIDDVDIILHQFQEITDPKEISERIIEEDVRIGGKIRRLESLVKELDALWSKTKRNKRLKNYHKDLVVSLKIDGMDIADDASIALFIKRRNIYELGGSGMEQILKDHLDRIESFVRPLEKVGVIRKTRKIMF